MEVAKDYSLIFQLFNLRSENIIFEDLFADEFLKVSYHLLGFNDRLIIIRYRKRTDYGRIEKFVNVITDLSNKKTIREILKSNIAGVEKRKFENVLGKIVLKYIGENKEEKLLLEKRS